MKSACGHRPTYGHLSPPLPTIGASWLALEPRIMFDGAAPATVDSVAAEQLAQSQAESSVSPDDVTTSDTPPMAPTGEPQFSSNDQALFDALAAYDTSVARQEILFLSPSVRDYQKLLDGISPIVEVFVLDPARDGVEQIAQTLADWTGIDAIHLISHGSEGALYLGTARLTLDSMTGEHAADLAGIAQALSEKADLLLYGCSFGQGEQGAEAALRLSQLTGADVAASTDDTGHHSLGGDWDLEFSVGPIETAQVFTSDSQQNWSHLLATEDVLDNFSSVSYSNNNGSQSWTTGWVETEGGGAGPGAGQIRVTGGALFIDAGLGTVGNNIYREANLIGALSATLTYSYTASLGVGGAIQVQISDDGGASYTTLETYTPLLPSSGSGNFDVSAYISANTRIRFEVTGALLLNNIQFDDIQISYVTNEAPVIANLAGDSLAYNEGAGAVVIEQGGNATVSDVDSANFDTGTLTVSFAAGSDSAEDMLSIRNQGTGAGQIGVSGANVTYGGVTIGTFTGGSGGANLVVTLNSSATPTAAQTLLRNLTYQNTDTDNPTTGARTVRFALTDGDGGSSGNHDTTVTVSGVNDVPVVSGAGGTLAYTEGAGAQVIDGTLTIADVDDTNIESATISLTSGFVSGEDVLAFTNAGGITGSYNAATGILTLTGSASVAAYEAALENIIYENTNTANPNTGNRTVTWVVNDGTANSTGVTSTITVAGGNDAPTITSNGGGATAAVNAAENQTAVTTVTSSDVDGGTPSYSIVGGADAALFSINATTGALVFLSAPNREAPTDAAGDNVYEVTVQVADGAGGTDAQAISVTVTDVDEFDVTAPADANGTANAVNENAANGSVIGITASASDADATNNTVTYSLTDSAGSRFVIDANAGVVTVADGTLLNREAAASHNITVRATSSDGSTADTTFTINLNDVDEFDVPAPVDSNAGANTVAEDASVGTAVGLTAFANDADATINTITYSLDDNAGGRFAIDANTGVVAVAGGLDYETNTTHNVTVRANSADGSFATQLFTINITDVNEAGVTPTNDTNGAANNAVENSAIGTLVGVTAFADDPDGTDMVSYSLDDNAGGRFAIDSNTGVVTVAGVIDREVAGSYNITIRSTSTDTSSTTLTLSIAISDIDEFDVGAVGDVNAVGNTVTENASVGTVVGITASAGDADATTNTITYSLQDNDSSRFQIDANTGVVTIAGAIDRETDGPTRNITVRATSADGSFTDQVFTINVNDVDEFDVAAPGDGNAATNAVNENASNGTTVGITANAIDADATTNTVTYSLTDSVGGRFAIDANTGVVMVADGTLLNREAAASHNITVRATSSDGSTADTTFTIDINDVDEFDVTTLVDINAVANAVDENAANGTTVDVTANAGDPDATTNTITYALDDSAGGRFAIDANTGVVTVANGTLLDREAAASHNITVRASSADGSFSTQSFSIAVNPVNDNNPLITSNGGGAMAAVSVAENTTAVTTVTATDADLPAQPLTYSIVGGADQALFTINSVIGALSFLTAPDFENPTDAGGNNLYDVTVQVSDGNGGTDQQALAVTVTNVNDAPVVGDDAVVTTENTAVTTGNVLANDSDVDSVLSPASITAFDVVSVNGGTVVNNGDGTFTYTPGTNFTGIDTFTYTVSDGLLSDTATVTITVTTAGNSAPSLTANTGSTGIQGLTDVITLGELQVTDADNSPAQLTYTITTAPINGRLELTTAPGVAVTIFTQADIDAGRLVFVHSGAVATSDSFAFTVSDGAGGTIGATTFTFTVAPFIPPPSGGGGNGGSGGGDSTGGSGGTGTGTGSGMGSGSGNGGDVVPPPLQPPSVLISTEVPVEDVLVKDLSAKEVSVVGATYDLLPRAVIANPTFASIEQPDTAIQESEQLSLPVKNVLAVGHTLAERLTRLADDLERGIQEREYQTHLVGRLASLFGIALSAGFVAWILRGGSLVASFLGSMPAWRHFDPLPVLEMGEGDGRRRDRKMHEEAEGEKMLLPANPNSERRGS